MFDDVYANTFAPQMGQFVTFYTTEVEHSWLSPILSAVLHKYPPFISLKGFQRKDLIFGGSLQFINIR